MKHIYCYVNVAEKQNKGYPYPTFLEVTMVPLQKPFRVTFPCTSLPCKCDALHIGLHDLFLVTPPPPPKTITLVNITSSKLNIFVCMDEYCAFLYSEPECKFVRDERCLADYLFVSGSMLWCRKFEKAGDRQMNK